MDIFLFIKSLDRLLFSLIFIAFLYEKVTFIIFLFVLMKKVNTSLKNMFCVYYLLLVISSEFCFSILLSFMLSPYWFISNNYYFDFLFRNCFGDVLHVDVLVDFRLSSTYMGKEIQDIVDLHWVMQAFINVSVWRPGIEFCTKSFKLLNSQRDFPKPHNTDQKLLLNFG